MVVLLPSWRKNKRRALYLGNNCHKRSWYRWHVELPVPGSAFADDWSGTKPTLKRKCRHFDEIFITGCSESCHFDNFQYSQWWKFHQNEDISVSVQDHLMTRGLTAYTASLLIQIVTNNLKYWESTMSLQDMTIVFNKKWIKMDRKQKNVRNTGHINLQWWIQNPES